MSEHTGNLFLLGCGFDRAIFGDAIPLNNELLKALLKFTEEHPEKIKRVNDAQKTPLYLNLKAFCDHVEEYRQRHGFSSVEDLSIETYLTFLDIEMLHEAKGGPSSQLRKLVNLILTVYFREFRFSRHENLVKRKPWLKTFAEEILYQDDAIVSLNYTTFLESLLDFHKVWSFKGGYPQYVRNPLAYQNKYNFNLADFKNIVIYKIHGSEHFLEVRKENDPVSELWFEINTELFHSHEGEEWRGYRDIMEPFVIAPSYVKKYPHGISMMMVESIQKARSAKNLLVMGCSLREEDSILWLLLNSFCEPVLESKAQKTIFILDPKAKSLAETMVQNLHVASYGDKIKIHPINEMIEHGLPELFGKLKPALGHGG